MLIWMLRITSGVMLTALVFVFCPFEWMAAIHRQMGLGELAYTPLMSYLTRTLSALYANLGAMILLVSFDIDRYRPVIRLIAALAILGGVGVTALDATLRLPVLWIALEGPPTAALGVIVFALVSVTTTKTAA
jgi:hypothetical protein